VSTARFVTILNGVHTLDAVSAHSTGCTDTRNLVVDSLDDIGAPVFFRREPGLWCPCAFRSGSPTTPCAVAEVTGGFLEDLPAPLHPPPHAGHHDTGDTGSTGAGAATTGRVADRTTGWINHCPRLDRHYQVTLHARSSAKSPAYYDDSTAA
jgi:hypothetical protein